MVRRPALTSRLGGLVQCANAHLAAFGQDLVLVKTAFILVCRSECADLLYYTDTKFSPRPAITIEHCKLCAYLPACPIVTLDLVLFDTWFLNVPCAEYVW